MQFEIALQIVEKEVTELKKRAPEINPEIEDLITELELKYAHVSSFDDVPSFFKICDGIDEYLTTHELKLSHAQKITLLTTRFQMLNLVVDHLFEEKKTHIKRGEYEKSAHLAAEKKAAHLAIRLVPFLRGNAPEKFNKQWIKENCASLLSFIPDIDQKNLDQEVDWYIFREMLPPDLRDRFVVKNLSAREHLIEDIKSYYKIAQQLGPEALIQYLISLGKIPKDIRVRSIFKDISDCLGPCRRPRPTFEDVFEYPTALLRLTGVQKTIFILLRNHLYQRLIQKGFDQLHPLAHRGKLEEIEKEIDFLYQKHLADLKNASPDETAQRLPIIKGMLDKLKNYFRETLSLKSPDRLVDRLPEEHKRHCPFPSVRQQIAMKEMSRANELINSELKLLDQNIWIAKKNLLKAEKSADSPQIKSAQNQLTTLEDKRKELAHEIELSRRKLIGFFMDKGKTATAFLCKEHLGCKKMLYVCPPGKLVRQTRDRVKKYYKEKEVPTIGVIEKGITKEKLAKALQAEIVIIPYSMLNREVENRPIVEFIKECDFDILVEDEAHEAKSVTAVATKRLYEIATETNNGKLYKEGYILKMSGEITPNTADDLAPHLRTYDNLMYASLESLKALINQTNPLTFRNIILDYLLLIDEPEDWSIYRQFEDFDLFPDERVLYNSFASNDLLTHQEKYRLLRFLITNPALFTPDREIKSALLDTLIKKTNEFLFSKNPNGAEYQNLLIAEHYNKHGVTRSPQKLAADLDLEEEERQASERAEYFFDYAAGTVIKEDAEDHQTKSCRQNGNGANEIIENIYVLNKFAQHYGQQGYEVNIYDGKNIPQERAASEKTIDIYVIDGTANNINYRLHAIEAAKRTDRKTILFCTTETIMHGIDLSHIHRVICLNPAECESTSAQLTKRFAREGNTDVIVSVIRARDTVHEGICNHALDKAERNFILQYGGVLTDIDLEKFDQTDLDPDTLIIGELELRLGTLIMEKIFTKEEKLTGVLAKLHNVGLEVLEEFLKNYGRKFAEKYIENWERSYHGNNARFVASLIKELENTGHLTGGSYADLACGPLVLENTLENATDRVTPRHISSLDYSQDMLEMGKLYYLNQKKEAFIESQKENPVEAVKAFKKSFDLIQPLLIDILEKLQDVDDDALLNGKVSDEFLLKNSAVILDQLKNFPDFLKQLFNFDPLSKINTSCGSITQMRHFENGAGYPDNHFDLINCALALHYTGISRKIKTIEKAERVNALLEFNRVLKKEGTLILTFPYSLGTATQRANFLASLESHFGFQVLQDYTGEANSIDNSAGHYFKNWTITCQKIKEPNLNGLKIDTLILSRQSEEAAEPSHKFSKKDLSASKKSKGYIHREFEINQNTFNYDQKITGAEAQSNRSDRVKTARAQLQKFYFQNGGHLMSLTPDQKQIIDELNLGVKIARVEGKINYFFCFKDETSDAYAEQIFPIDEEGNMITA